MSYIALSIGLFIFIVAFFSTSQSFQDLVSSAFPPYTELAQEEAQETVDVSQFCQLVPESDAPTFRAPADNADKIGSKNNPALGTPIFNPDCKSDGPNHQFSKEDTTYRLIRRNVPITKNDIKHNNENFTGHSCHFDSAEELGINIPEVSPDQYRIFYPQISGEIDMKRAIPSRTRGGEGEKTLLYFIDYGLIFALHVNADGGYTELAGSTIEGKPETFVLADIYQDIESPGRDNLPDEALSCDTTRGAAIAQGPRVTIPESGSNLPPDQLQLQYFVFGTAGGSSAVVNGWGIHCKPAVYLYPPEKKLVNVKVTPKGYLTYTDPPYDPDSGWTIEAYPDGTLLTLDKLPVNNNYLYFESKIHDSVIQKPEAGWIRKSADLENLYREILPKLGLNQKQQTDFIDYWTKALPDAPYYFVGLIDQANVNEFEKLEITPKPDSINRVRFYFERLESPKAVQTPSLTSKSQIPNSKFQVVEWGGMVKNDPNHPFTCSQ